MIDFQLGFAPLLILLFFLVFAAIKILREYERGVIFLLGRFWKVKGPGLVIVIPGIQQMVKVDLRVVTMDVPPQDVISRDNVSVKVNAIVFFRVVDPEKAIIQVENFLVATSQLAQTTLRAVLGKHELDEMLAERERLNLDVQQILDAQTDSWGIKVTNVEIKHIDLNESMVRAIARQAEAERERRAKVIHAEGEKQAADITYIATGEGWLYLAVVLDLYDRSVVGWSIKPRMTTDLVTDALTMAWYRRKPGWGLVHHSDRGSQYASQTFQAKLQEFGMVCSMSRKGNCWDNAVAESFFNSLKNERVHGQHYDMRDHAKADLFDYIEAFYNRSRRHSTLGGKSPAWTYEAWLKRHQAQLAA